MFNLFNEISNKAKINNENLTLLTIDIDHFKKVNDTYGHVSGDFVLKELGKILIKAVRDFDIVSRIGGEEFTVILRDCDQSYSYQIAERIRKEVENHRFKLPCGKNINITISIGMAVYPDEVKNLHLLKSISDEKLYEAKRGGRTKVCA